MIGHLSDTICALSTAKGKGAIAVIRVSGPHCFKIVDTIFAGAKKIDQMTHASIARGDIVAANKAVIDDVLIAKFANPNSFTGQDIIEICCHGGLYIVQEILSLLLENGVRAAEPGEFTKRAFLNGKMDLLQAESIADVIDAQTRTSLTFAHKQLSGVLSDTLLHVKEKLKMQLALLEVELDFSDEDIEFASRQEIKDNIDSLIKEIAKLIDSFKYGKIAREGVHLALAGKPNVGKSSVLNRLLQEERAIVSEIPGTTRDIIEEALDIQGLLFKISDTAGLRITESLIESKGIEKTKETLKKADLILFIMDASEALDHLDVDALNMLELYESANVFLVLNKIDIRGNKINAEFVQKFPYASLISAKTGQGFESFKTKLVDINLHGMDTDSSAVLTRVRHRDALQRCKEHIVHAQNSIEQNLSAEFIALDIRAALDALGEITGEVTTDDILNDIFSKFCIGK